MQSKALRRIEVPAEIKLDRLPVTLLPALDWTTRPVDVLEGAGIKTLRYLYDFGDAREHAIKTERLTDPEPDVASIPD